MEEEEQEEEKEEQEQQEQEEEEREEEGTGVRGGRARGAARNLVATCPNPNEFLAIGIYNIFVNFSKIGPILFSKTC